MSQDSSDQRPPQSESLQTISSDNTTTTTKHTEKRISETKLENGNHCLSDIARVITHQVLKEMGLQRIWLPAVLR